MYKKLAFSTYILKYYNVFVLNIASVSQVLKSQMGVYDTDRYVMTKQGRK